LEPPDILEEYKAELRRRRDLNNPVELNRMLNGAAEKLLKLNREKYCTGNTPSQEGGSRALRLISAGIIIRQCAALQKTAIRVIL
jgi:hypothetical protein